MRSKEFRYRHFIPEVILQCLGWYLRYPISYRQLAEMVSERGIIVDHTTIFRWIQHYAPEFEKSYLTLNVVFCTQPQTTPLV